jgi:hypothetical protein
VQGYSRPACGFSHRFAVRMGPSTLNELLVLLLVLVTVLTEDISVLCLQISFNPFSALCDSFNAHLLCRVAPRARQRRLIGSR